MLRSAGKSAKTRAVVEALEDRRLMAAIVVVNLADAGAGSLRDAIAQANANPGADVITFDPGISGVITLRSAQLQISDTSGQTSIDGAGQITVDGGNFLRVLQIDASASAAISGLTIAHGRPMFTNTGFELGGGVYNLGTLRLANCAFNGNSGDIGGGIYSDGSLSIRDSTFTSNAAGWKGGAVYNGGSLNVARCTCTGGSSAGSGVMNEGSATISDSTFTANSGSALNNQGALNITRCTFAQNTAATGAGILNGYGTITASNCTFAGNSANGSGGQGGAIYLFNPYGSPPAVTITNCTITGNNAVSGGGGIYNLNKKLTINNSIVAGNTVTGIATPSDLDGKSYTRGSNNLIGTGGADGLSARTNIIGVAVADLHLGALADHGGPTQTIALLAGSPAIDAGSNSLASGLTTDQRLLARIAHGKVDIGAYEVQF